MDKQIMMTFTSNNGDFRVVAKSSGSKIHFIIEKKHFDALGDPSWRINYSDDIEEPFFDLLYAIFYRKYEIK